MLRPRAFHVPRAGILPTRDPPFKIIEGRESAAQRRLGLRLIGAEAIEMVEKIPPHDAVARAVSQEKAAAGVALAAKRPGDGARELGAAHR